MPDFNASQDKSNKLLDILVLLLITAILSGGFLLTVLCWYEPRALIFLGDLMPQKYYCYFPWGATVALFHTYLIVPIIFNTAFTSATFLVLLYYNVLIFTSELCLGRKQYRTIDLFRNCNNIPIAYRSLQILYAQFEGPLGQLIVILHLIFSVLPMYGFFVLICYRNDVNAVAFYILLIGSTTFICFWTFVLQLGNYLCVNGAKSMRSWGLLKGLTASESKIMSRFRRSCQPILIGYGRTIKLQRITPFTYIKGNIRGIMRLVLTLPRV